jgi:hypothetical protein
LETALVKARHQTSELQAELRGRHTSGDDPGRVGADAMMSPSEGGHRHRSGSKDSRDSGKSGHGHVPRSALRGADPRADTRADTPSGRGQSVTVAAVAAAAAAAAAVGAHGGPPPVVAAALVEELLSAAADAAKTDPALAAHLRGIAQALNSIQSLLVAELSAFEQARGHLSDCLSGCDAHSCCCADPVTRLKEVQTSLCATHSFRVLHVA